MRVGRNRMACWKSRPGLDRKAWSASRSAKTKTVPLLATAPKGVRHPYFKGLNPKGATARDPGRALQSFSTRFGAEKKAARRSLNHSRKLTPEGRLTVTERGDRWPSSRSGWGTSTWRGNVRSMKTAAMLAGLASPRRGGGGNYPT